MEGDKRVPVAPLDGARRRQSGSPSGVRETTSDSLALNSLSASVGTPRCPSREFVEARQETASSENYQGDELPLVDTAAGAVCADIRRLVGERVGSQREDVVGT